MQKYQKIKVWIKLSRILLHFAKQNQISLLVM
jgi:hypothetical protein